MEESQKTTGKTESHLPSAAAFVEGGIQDACDDACSICLEAFCKSDPSTVTSCKHEFHLQCVLEWCQRSSQCPMCWQPISLMDLTSQELFESVEQERNARANNARTATIFHHPAFGDFDLRDLAVGRSDAEMEERFFQHLAAAASIGRAHYISRREGRFRPGSQGHAQYLVFSPNSNTSGVSDPATAPRGADNEPVDSIIASEPLISATTPERELAGVANVNPDQATQIASSTSGASSTSSRHSISTTGTSAGQSSLVSQDGPGPSDLQSLSESLKSRLNSVSMKYKESISKSTRGWRERLFSRNNSVADIGSEVRREITAGIATVKSRMMERLEKRENRSSSPASPSSPMHSPMRPNNDVVANHAYAHTNSRTTNDGFIVNHTDTHPKNIPTSSWVVTSDPN